MIFEYTLTKEETIGFHTKNVKKTFIYKAFKRKTYLFVFLTFMLMLFIMIIIPRESRLLVLKITFISELILLLFRGKLFKLFTKIKLASSYCNNKEYLFCPTTLEINENGIIIKTNYNNDIIKWRGIKDIYIINKFVLIRTFIEDDILIPFRSIKSNDDLKALLLLFKENTSVDFKCQYPKDIELF